MGLRTKFNLMLLAVAIVGLGLFALAATPILETLARNQVTQSSRIMMESAAGARKYTSEQIAPLLKGDLETTFHPQAVSAYAAKKNFDVLHARYSDFSYREAALNPTNLEDKASEWEADVIHEFRDHPQKTEAVLERDTPNGRSLVLARPLVAKPACLVCHSTAEAAPKSMVDIYGPVNGFGWQANEIIGAQIVSVPMALPLAEASRVRLVFLAVFAGVFALLFLLMNVLLGVMVVGPVDKMTGTIERVSLGETDVPEYERKGSDQIARLAQAINRMRRSLDQALSLLSS
jgi:methyl-accepting chemotaxis protein